MHSVVWLFSGIIGGGSLLKLIDYLIAYQNERREQRREHRAERNEERASRSEEMAHEKDRPRFEIKVTKGETSHTNVPAVSTKIISLGSLPLTINKGKISIQTRKCPKGVQDKDLSSRDIGPSAPIIEEIRLPEKFVNSEGTAKERFITVVVDFSYRVEHETDEHSYHEDVPQEITGWY